MISTLARWTAFIAVTVILVLGRPVIGSLAFSDPAPSASARSAADRTAAARSAPRVVVQWGDPERDGVPRYRAIIDNGAGQITQYVVDNRDLDFVSRVQQLDRQLVDVTIASPSAAFASGNAASLPRLTEISPVPGAASRARLITPPAWVVQRRPYAVVLHGAEITFPGRTPGTKQLLARVLRGASAVIAAGGYPAREGERAAGRRLPVTVIPPRTSSAESMCASSPPL